MLFSTPGEVFSPRPAIRETPIFPRSPSGADSSFLLGRLWASNANLWSLARPLAALVLLHPAKHRVCTCQHEDSGLPKENQPQ